MVYLMIKHRKKNIFVQGRSQEFVQGRINFSFFFRYGAQHPLGPENPLKSIDFTSLFQGAGLSPHSTIDYPSGIGLQGTLNAIIFKVSSFVQVTLYISVELYYIIKMGLSLSRTSKTVK